MPDAFNSTVAHYCALPNGLEAIDVIDSVLGQWSSYMDSQDYEVAQIAKFSFAMGNTMKYLLRAAKKDNIRDLVKAGDYLQRCTKILEHRLSDAAVEGAILGKK